MKQVFEGIKRAWFVLLSVFLVTLTGCQSKKEKSEIPRPDHIVIVMEENHGYDQILGSRFAPYINELAKRGANFTNAHGILHPSQPNYIGLFSGSLQGVTGDECYTDSIPFNTPNLGRALIDKGFTFAGYSQTMPYAGFKGCDYGINKLTGSRLYLRKHAPWVNWQDADKNGLDGKIVSLPFTEFPGDFSKLPTVSFVIPDGDHDMHNQGGDTATIRRADDWLRDHLSAYIDWAESNNSLFILSYDEDNDTWENHIPTIFTGQMVKPGNVSDSINLYHILRTIEAMYDLPESGDAEAFPIKNIWKEQAAE